MPRRVRPSAGAGSPAAFAASVEPLEARALLSAAPAAVAPAAAPDLEVHAYPAADPAPLAAAAAAEAAASGFDPALAFRLHSRPGASKVIYLDFDGHRTSGTVWNSYYNGGADIVSPAYNRDGDPSTFSDAERAEIYRIWQRVAEDFAPFDVDVTTQDPGLERLRKSGSGDAQWGIRAVQTGDKGWISDDMGSVGGIGYNGSFNWNTDTPVFSFNAGEVYAADTLSHEIGHALGLDHDGSSSGQYYYGHGSGATGWAPLMGAGFNKQLSQWSQGEYAGASNTQDDLAIITTRNGFGYRADDHGGTFGSARALAWAGAGLSAAGVIERSTDRDVFAIDVSAAGTLTLNVDPAERGPNLDVLAELFDAAGRLVASSNPLSALDASLSVLVTAGRYYLRVDGAGRDGSYSDYGSLGQYTVTGSFLGGAVTPTVTVAAVPGAVAEDAGGEILFTFARTGSLTQALTATFAVGGAAAYGSDYAVSGAASFSGSVGTVTFAAGSATAVVRVRPTADALAEPDEAVVLTLTEAAGYDVGVGAGASGTIADDDPPAAVTGLSARAVSSTRVDLAWSAAAGAASYEVERSGDGGRSWTKIGTTAGTSYAATGLAAGTSYAFRVRALNAHGPGAWSATAAATTPADNSTPNTVGLVAAPGAGFAPLVKVYDPRGEYVRFQFYAYGLDFTGGVRVAVGDVNGDGTADIVTAPASGAAPVRVFDGLSGVHLRSFFAFPENPGFGGGITLAVADVNRDGAADIVLSVSGGAGPAVRVVDGRTGGQLARFWAFAENPSFTGGINLAAADVDGDGRAEVITAIAGGAGPAVRVLDALTGQVVSRFWAFAENPTFRGGVNVAAGDVNGDGRAEVIAAIAGGAGPAVRVLNPLTGGIVSRFWAFPENTAFTGGVSVEVTDVNLDGRVEVLAAPATGAQATVRRLDPLTGQLLGAAQAYPADFIGGAFLAGQVVPTAAAAARPAAASLPVSIKSQDLAEPTTKREDEAAPLPAARPAVESLDDLFADGLTEELLSSEIR